MRRRQCITLLGGEDTIRLAETDGHPYTLVLAYAGVGNHDLGKGELHKTIPLLDRALELCRVWDLYGLRSGVEEAVGYALLLSGQIPESLAVQALALARERQERGTSRQVQSSTRAIYGVMGRAMPPRVLTAGVEQLRGKPPWATSSCALEKFANVSWHKINDCSVC